jgi:hypothetical protein
MKSDRNETSSARSSGNSTTVDSGYSKSDSDTPAGTWQLLCAGYNGV